MTNKLVMLFLVACCAQAQSSPKAVFDAMSVGERYILGAGDHVTVRVTGADEITDRPIRIEDDGTIRLPLVGQIRASGITVEEFEKSLTAELKKYIRDPQVIVSVAQLRSQPVTFAGAFRNPGIYNLVGNRTLTEMMAVAGGLEPTASRLLRISRRSELGTTRLPGERREADGDLLLAMVDISVVPGQRNKSDVITLLPFEVVTAVPDEPIIVSGEVVKVGGLYLGDLRSMSLLQAITTSGGLTREASKNIKIFRPIADSTEKVEIHVDLEKLLKGEEKDPLLLAKDVVLVPRATGKALAIRIAGLAGGLAVSVFGGLAIAGR